jgi:hypothetical protein
MKISGVGVPVAVIAAAALAGEVRAEDGAFQKAIGETKPLLDLRIRMENVDQDGIVEDAHATTVRARFGFETGKAWNTSLLVEGEGVLPIQDDYRPDPAVPTMTSYPVVADPESYEVNRFQLTTTAGATTVTLGRQRIALDDQRFVGPVGWRQNEQTFDALRIVNKSVKGLTLDATYFTKVNRIFGEDSPQGDYKGDSGLFNTAWQTKKAGKITAFGYLLDFENVAGVPAAVRDSTSTYGLRWAGETPAGKIKLAYALSLAEQSDYADNPLDFDLGYRYGELTASYQQFSLGYGMEIMEGDGVKGFTTPLATLHKFNGWADKFLGTPPNGIEDRFITAGVTLKKVLGLDSLALVAAHHEYDAERVSADYGSEINVSLAAKYKKVSFMLKLADFDEGVLATARTTQKVWAQVEYAW